MPAPRRPRPRSALASVLVAAVVTAVVAGCGGTADEPDADGGSGPTGAASPTADGPISVEMVIENSQVSPTVNRIPVDIGDEVHLAVTSDEDDRIHVHGVERFLTLTAGEQGVLEFTIAAGLPRGTYLVEAHDGGLILFELRVR